MTTLQNTNENDRKRGIQNTQIQTSRYINTKEAFEAESQKRLLQEQLRNKAKTEKEEDAEENARTRRILVQTASQGASQNVLEVSSLQKGGAKKIRGAGGAGVGRFLGLGALFWCGLFQLIFGLVSALFFGMHFAIDAACDNTFAKPFCFVISKLSDLMSYFPIIGTLSALTPENLAWAFWGLIFTMTILIFASYVLLSHFQGVSLFDGPLSLAGAALMFTLNIVPLLNIFPWIELWATYVTLKGALSTAKQVSALIT